MSVSVEGKPLYARVIVNVQTDALDRPFDYLVPKALQECIQVGSHVIIPFGNRRIDGFVVEFASTTNTARTKEILSIVGNGPVLGPAMLDLASWVRDIYACRAADILKAMLPGAIREMKIRALRALESGEPARRRSRSPNAAPVSGKVAGYFDLVESLRPAKIRLSEAQAKAVATILKACNEERPRPILLHGVTASGKTEVYLECIQALLAAGKSSAVLVPEISLTPQIVGRFRTRFGDRIAVLHSRLSAGEKAGEWMRIASGEAMVAIGARSCVFAPCKDLGLIVIDEEHESSYKQEEAPRYHAREVAIHRAYIEHAAVVLGSATPSIESYHRAVSGEYEYIELKERVDSRPMPAVEIVDMRQELAAGNRGVFSRRLRDAIAERLARRESIMLFLNRRGYATFIICRECGHVLRCPNCDVSLTLHLDEKTMRCHWCDHREPIPHVCPACGGHRVGQLGVGTERVEAEVRRAFPSARVLRMDTDTTRRKGSHEAMLSSFASGEYDILVGTQMIAKGLDFPGVTLVGVVSADTALNFPDFRSSERTFQLLVQVAGRAGRGDVPGEVVVQTYSPSHYSIAYAASYDYSGFFEEEIKARRGVNYPPFCHLISIIATSPEEAKAVKVLESIASVLSGLSNGAGVDAGFQIMGPTPLVVKKARGEYRWRIVIKVQDVKLGSEIVRSALSSNSKNASREGVKVAVDVDPQSML